MSGKGRPKALQVETSAITAKNRTLDTLLTNEHFTKAMKSLDQGWVFDSQETAQFPHYSNDLRSLPTHLRRLLNHKPRSRGRASTLKDSNSPSSSSHGEREREKERESRLPCGSATNPEDRGLKTEMNRTEGYHIHTSCVQLAFVDSYTHQATLRTTSFVDDFPIHVWVFIPPSLLDKSLANQEPAVPVPTASPMGGAHSEKIHDAMISFIAHAPRPVKAKLERLQLLFIMRLKDSFTEFKNSLMRFLVLPSSNNKLATKGEREREKERGEGRREGQLGEKMFEMTNLSRDASNRPEHLQLLDSLSSPGQDRNSTSLQHVRSASQGHIPDGRSSIHDGKSTVGDKSAGRGSTPSSVLSSGSSESDISATISGCVIIESIEACIVLPSILKAHGVSSSGTPVGNAVSPKSPSTPLAGAGGSKKLPSVAEAAKRAENAIRVPKSEVQESGNGVLESKNENREPKQPSEVNMSLYEGGVENHFGERPQVSMPHPSQGSQIGFITNMPAQGSLQSSQTGLSMSASGSATPSPRISPAPSQTSLTSQTSQSSQFSLSLGSNMSNAHSPSITSLPTLIESGDRDSLSGLGQSLNYPRGNPTTGSGRGPAIPSSLNIRPPMRSLSASHLPPSAMRGSTTAQPRHPTTSTLPPHGRNSVSPVVRGRSSTPTFQDRHSPVSAIIHEGSRGYTTNYITTASQMGERETQSERSSPVVHVTAIGGTGTVIETQYESKALWSESPHEESDFIMVGRPEHMAGKKSTRSLSPRHSFLSIYIIMFFFLFLMAPSL